MGLSFSKRLHIKELNVNSLSFQGFGSRCKWVEFGIWGLTDPLHFWLIVFNYFWGLSKVPCALGQAWQTKNVSSCPDKGHITKHQRDQKWQEEQVYHYSLHLSRRCSKQKGKPSTQGGGLFVLIACYPKRYLYSDFYSVCWSPNFSAWRMGGQRWGLGIGKEVLTYPRET